MKPRRPKPEQILIEWGQNGRLADVDEVAPPGFDANKADPRIIGSVKYLQGQGFSVFSASTDSILIRVPNQHALVYETRRLHRLLIGCKVSLDEIRGINSRYDISKDASTVEVLGISDALLGKHL